MTRRNRFFANALLLTAAALGMRGVGMLFNLYLTARLGAAGLGRFSLVMSVYGFAVTLASAGIGLAVTRVVSEAGETDSAAPRIRGAVRTGLLYSFLTGSSSALLLLLFSAPIGTYLLRDTESIPSLRVLALSLVPLALSAALGGYFTARRRAFSCAVVGVSSQLSRIAMTVLLLHLWSGKGAESACLALVIGCLVSEIVGLLLSWLLYFPDAKRLSRTAAKPEPRRSARSAHSGTQTTQSAGTVSVAETVSRAIIRIAVPIAMTACIRSGLGTLLHLLIPSGLRRSGIGAEEALAAYGTVHGVVLPVLLFPAALLQSAASLLVPEIAAFRASGDKNAVQRWEKRMLGTTLCYAIFVSGIMLCFSEELGALLGGNAETGTYLHTLAALIPVMYLDTVVDAFLKGLDEQVASMRYNILDAAFCVLMAYLLLPALGIRGYCLLLYASEIFNLALSLSKLISVTGLRIPVLHWVVTPAVSVIGAGSLAVWFLRGMANIGITFRFAWVGLFVHILVTGIFYGGFLWVFGKWERREG